MAMSAAERKRLQVERQRARARQSFDLVQPISKPPLGEWLESNAQEELWQHLVMCYDGMNRQTPDFTQDTDPVSASGAFEFPTTPEGAPSYTGALGRAELEVELLLEAAKTLAKLINRYKREAISTRLSKIEKQDLADPDKRSDGLQEAVVLSKAMDKLDRSVRTDVPQWQLRG
ncbi:hypothetical protein [Thioclava sp. F36-6]|uniref:hypothetical protein n=1 Tax=Thioclava sp. F36-6 TaxID=1915316 RepID=UPI0009984F1E|nr:hypothetical protein [Thioclava sp. F36-6]OOY31276.1 hypothetical protein BMI88_09155 [Thioclava sp. F36-6]